MEKLATADLCWNREGRGEVGYNEVSQKLVKQWMEVPQPVIRHLDRGVGPVCVHQPHPWWTTSRAGYLEVQHGSLIKQGFICECSREAKRLRDQRCVCGFQGLRDT